MKVGDIKEVPDVAMFGLQEIYDLQKALIKPFQGIEGLPDYPLDPDTKDNQALLKDFMARIVEELGEAYQEFEILYDLAMAKDKDEAKLLKHLSDFNEEAADAMHFFIELLIYVNIEASSVYGYSNMLMNDLNLNIEPCTLANLIKLCQHENQLTGKKHWNSQTGYHIGIPYNLSGDGVDEFLRAGRKIGPEQKMYQKELLWEVTYSLQLVRNLLKNKPLVQCNTVTNVDKLQETTVQAFLHFMCWLTYMGHTPESIWAIYYKNNQVNLQRIKDKR